MDMAEITAPLLLKRCDQLLRRYIDMEAKCFEQNRDPSQEIRDEIRFVLQELASLHLHPRISKLLYSGGGGDNVRSGASVMNNVNDVDGTSMSKDPNDQKDGIINAPLGT
eukprot:1323173-Amorphochlora_amoeboformis.AAC.2